MFANATTPFGATAAAVSVADSETLMQGMDHFLRHLGYDLPTAIGFGNVKVISFIVAITFLAVLLFDWLSYNYASHNGTASSYSSYGRKLITTAADVWDQRNMIGLGPYLRNGRSMDDLEPMMDILNSLSKAVHKWDRLDSKKENSFKSRILF